MRQSIGIDISARTLWVAYETGRPPAKISLKEPDWQTKLLDLIQPGATVALEPTGWAYSAPIIRTLKHISATVYMVEHSLTGHVRAAQVSSAKNDQTDAHALRRIAINPDAYRGVSLTDERVSERNTRLRLLVNTYQRVEKECTRSTNRARQLAHSIHPKLGLSFSTYRRAARLGFVTPDELRELADQIAAYNAASKQERAAHDLPAPYRDGRVSRHLVKLVQSIPPWASADNIRDIIVRELATRRYFGKQRQVVRRDLYALISETEEWRRLAELWMTVPSANLGAVGSIVSATHGAVTQMTPERFRAAVGVHPKVSQSGEDAQSVAGRPGFKRAKGALHLWAMRLIQTHEKNPNPVGLCFAVHEARKHKGAFFAARAKLANILYGIAKSGKPYDPHHAQKDG